MCHADEFIECCRVLRQSKVEGQLFAELRIVILMGKLLDCRKSILTALAGKPERCLLAKPKVIAGVGETDQCRCRRIRLVDRNGKHCTIAKTSGIALSSEISQHSNAVIRINAVQPNE